MLICPDDVINMGTGLLLRVMHMPPMSLGSGVVEACSVGPRLRPKMETRLPGLMAVLYVATLTTPPPETTGRSATLVGVRLTTLSPLVVMA
jgi:hypothetical protein